MGSLDIRPNSLSIIKAKVHRTKAQINDFDQAVRGFISTNRYEMVSDLNFDGTERIWRFVLTNQDTSELSVIAGEVIHNLRSPLDNMACAIAKLHTGRDDRTYFPFGKNIDIFESEVKRKTKDLPAAAITMMRGLKPYNGGNDLLWAVHNLNRSDKHPGLNAVQSMQSAMMSGLKVFLGKALILGNRHGQHLVAGGYVPKTSPLAIHKEGEFLTTTPIAQFQYDGEPTFQIAFSEAPGFERESIIAVLHQMRDLVEGILLTFEQRFF